MMEMKSTLMKRVWEIGEGFKHSLEDVESELKEILYIDKESELLDMIRKDVEAGHGESVISVRSAKTDEVTSRITVQHLKEEKDSFGDIIPAHAKIVYQNLN